MEELKIKDEFIKLGQDVELGRTESSAPTAADAAFQIHYHTAGLEHGIYKALATLLL